MRSTLRSIAAVFAGFMVASIVMMIIESTNGHVLYPELGKAAKEATDHELDRQKLREKVRELMATAPAGALVVVIAGWTLGGVAGGWVAGRLAPKANIAHGLALGALLMLAGVANNLMIPPPLWFWIVSLAVLIPAACLGARLAPKRVQ